MSGLPIKTKRDNTMTSSRIHHIFVNISFPQIYTKNKAIKKSLNGVILLIIRYFLDDSASVIHAIRAHASIISQTYSKKAANSKARHTENNKRYSCDCENVCTIFLRRNVWMHRTANIANMIHPKVYAIS